MTSGYSLSLLLSLSLSHLVQRVPGVLSYNAGIHVAERHSTYCCAGRKENLLAFLHLFFSSKFPLRGIALCTKWSDLLHPTKKGHQKEKKKENNLHIHNPSIFVWETEKKKRKMMTGLVSTYFNENYRSFYNGRAIKMTRQRSLVKDFIIPC